MAIGEFAKPIYQLIDDYGGQDVSSTLILDELIRWMKGEDIEKFVEDFRREHDVQPANLFEDDDTDLFELHANELDLCMDCQDSYDINNPHTCDTQITESRFFSSLIPSC